MHVSVKIVFKLLVLFLIFFKNTNSKKILAIFHTPSKSHQLLAEPLLFELAKAGHEVRRKASILKN